jgi:hypothetical protein
VTENPGIPTRPAVLAAPVPQVHPTPDWDAAVAAFYASTGNPGFEGTGEHFGVSRETVRQAIRRWETATGQTLDRAPARHRRTREQATLAKRLITPPSLAQRLLSRAHLNEETGCWDWDGRMHSQDGKSYPNFRALGEQFAHRISYRLWVGPIPDQHMIRRTCGRFQCIAPFHLRAFSQVAGPRSWMLGRRRPVATHCKRGHEYTADNIIWNPCTTVVDGERVTTRYRVCRTCVNDRLRNSPPPPKPKRPPLPRDYDERELELAIRRVEKAPAAKRAEALAHELETFVGTVDPAQPPALPNEPLHAYHTRTGGYFTGWFASRITDSPRVQKALRGKPNPRVRETLAAQTQHPPPP